MYSGPIIDTHMHLWDLANGYAWLNGPDPNFELLIGNYDADRSNWRTRRCREGNRGGLLAFRNIRGIRMPLNYDQVAWRRMADRGDYMGDAQWRRGFALLSRYGLSFDAQIYDHQAHDLAILARTFPESSNIWAGRSRLKQRSG
jgi:predicted TIM-barrel fold metal-dependent hydrolase